MFVELTSPTTGESITLNKHMIYKAFPADDGGTVLAIALGSDVTHVKVEEPYVYVKGQLMEGDE